MSRALDNPTGLTLATAVRLAYAAATRVRDDLLAGRLTEATVLLADTAISVAQQATGTVQTPAGRLFIAERTERALQATDKLHRALQDAAPQLRTGQPLTQHQQSALMTAAIALRISLQTCDVDLRACTTRLDDNFYPLEVQHA
jgi:hypothetical protein